MSLTENDVRVDRRDGFALVTLDRDTKQNAVNTAMLNELLCIFGCLRDEESVLAIILTGAGDSFCSGADMDELLAFSPEHASRFAQVGQSLTILIEHLGKPVIAAVNGSAAGCGYELALACTWRIASTKAKFSQPEPLTGFIPGWGGLARLSRIVGASRALEMVLTGQAISAEEAVRVGLVNQVIGSDEELLPACENISRQVSRNAPLAVKYAIDAVSHSTSVAVADGLRFESALFGLCFATDDVQEGARAFLEKRQPVFRGK